MVGRGEVQRGQNYEFGEGMMGTGKQQGNEGNLVTQEKKRGVRDFNQWGGWGRNHHNLNAQDLGSRAACKRPKVPQTND